jgi:pimeloyl-ACP methyl ester carboxylesterase
MGRRVLSTLLPLALLAGACSAGAGGSGGSAASGPAPSGSSIGVTDSPEAGSVEGQWQGRIEIPGAPLSVGVTLTRTDGGHGGTFDVPAQGLSGAALTGVTVDGPAIGFAIAGIPGNPTYQGRFDGQRIAGTFTQSGQSFPLTLSRGAVAAPARPQEPQPPYPYRSTDVTYQGGVTIAGTLTEPEGDGPFPAVLLITGSGPQDRDETIAGHKPFLLIADTLTRAGYAVLRVDDRGVGGTGGVLAEATYDSLAGDVAAGLQYLRGRPDIRPDAVGLLGHSEGGYLAPLVAQTRPEKPDFVILMAGPAVRGKDILVEQNRLIMQAAGASPAEVDAQVEFVTTYADLIIAGDFAGASDLARQRVTEAGGNADTVPDAADESMRSLLSYDPAPALQSLTVPVLAVFGGRDLQVPPEQSEPEMRRLLAGDADATVRTFANLNHLMQPAATGLPTEYATIETTVDPAVLDTVVSWLQQRFPSG